jgi:hypothetical protein
MNEYNSIARILLNRFAILAFIIIITVISVMHFFVEKKLTENFDEEIISKIRSNDISIEHSPNKLLSGARRIFPSELVSSMALKPQLSGLRAAADQGDSRAACTLASALYLCGQRKYHDPLFDYPDEYFAGMSLKSEEKSAFALSLYEERKSAMCADMDESDFFDIDKRILQSALAGYPNAIKKIVLLVDRSSENDAITSEEFAVAYRENAEKMMNSAAEHGDIDAIASITMAYSFGYIVTPAGKVPVREDDVKALAAQSALAWIRANTEMEKLSPTHIVNDNEISRKSIRNLASRMDQNDLSRFMKIESNYILSYQEISKKRNDSPAFFDDFPERACAHESRYDRN